MTSFKRTIWTELELADCEVIDVDPGGSIRIRHPALKRPRWFVLSQAGNWYSRYTLRAVDDAEGYIIKGDLRRLIGP